MNENIFKEFLLKAENFCARSEHCNNEVLEKLKLWKAPEEIHPKIISYLQENKFIDEVRFAEAYARQKFRFDKWGKRKIRMALQHKKIQDETISNALDEIDENAYREMIQYEMQKKNKSIRCTNENERKAKLIRFAQSRAYEFEYLKLNNL